ncbi:MAG: hypothetical protein GEU71_00970 [Actinobacteria bacterium]|nr:hypothetical protein [Actinomycetota bacterium]
MEGTQRCCEPYLVGGIDAWTVGDRDSREGKQGGEDHEHEESPRAQVGGRDRETEGEDQAPEPGDA